MASIKDIKIGDVLTLSMTLKNMNKNKQRVVYGVNGSPFNPEDPEVLVIDDVGEERWIYLRTFVGFDDLDITNLFPSKELH